MEGSNIITIVILSIVLVLLLVCFLYIMKNICSDLKSKKRLKRLNMKHAQLMNGKL